MLLAEISASPNIRDLGVGVQIPLNESGTLGLQWRPTLSLEIGKAIDTPAPETSTSQQQSASDVEDPVVRINAKLVGHLRFRPEHPILGVSFVDLFTQNRFAYLPNVGGGRTHDLAVVGVELRFNEFAGLQVAYTVGEDSPEFNKTETVKLGFSVHF
jgi:hypothetical protein